MVRHKGVASDTSTPVPKVKPPTVKSTGVTPKTPAFKRDHIKFDSDMVFDTPATGYVTAQETLSVSEHDEGSDDDEAPEDVSFTGMRDAAVSEMRVREKQVEAKKDDERQKRKVRGEKVREQKNASKERKKRLQELEEKKTSEIPLFLPTLVLKDVTTTPQFDEDDADSQKFKAQRKKIIFAEPEKRDISRGEVTVRVLRAPRSKTLAPMSKTQLLKSRDKWLNRKSVRDVKQKKKIVF
ncbi:hypothetical protein V1512DRAFT_256724 [Lipomyces arxii]|uniref:uncharacterized protein n=1 Tax=Lipomyces arxii TaxID=56418 RepID=UPI0034CE300D